MQQWQEQVNNVIDIHSHILPSIDDGAASAKVSLDMLDAAAAIGFRTIVATPHLTERLTPEYELQIREAFRQIEIHARAKGIELLSGFEIRLSPDLPRRLDTGEDLALGQSRAVLIDLPFIDWPNYVEATLFEVQMAGFQPILAHPERYPEIQKDPSIGLRLAQRGIALQLTIGSLGGAFGKQARRTSERLLALGAVHLVATDAHSAGHRMAAVPAGLQRLNELVGPANVQQLALHAPSTLLYDGALPAPIPPIRRSWRSRVPFLS